MKRKLVTQSISNFNNLEIKITGSVEIFFHKSERDDYFEIKLNSENQSFNLDKCVHFINNDNDFFNFDIKSNLLDSLISILNNIKNKNELKKIMSVNIYIKNIDEISIYGDSAKIDIDSLSLKKLEINCANLKFNPFKSTLNILKLKSSNLKGSIDYNNQNKNINIVSNNADLTINKGDFKGEINIKANNSNYKNYNTGDKSLGELIIDFNNSNIKIN